MSAQCHQMRARLLARSQKRERAEGRVRLCALAAAALVMGGGAIPASGASSTGRGKLIAPSIAQETPGPHLDDNLLQPLGRSHCLHSLSESTDGLVSELMTALSDPDSLKLVETVVSPTAETLNLTILYWSTGDDGRPWLKEAHGQIDNSSCKARLTGLA